LVGFNLSGSFQPTDTEHGICEATELIEKAGFFAAFP
jgi:hypothetical protein